MAEFSEEYIEFRLYEVNGKIDTKASTKQLRKAIKHRLKKGDSYDEVSEFITSSIEYEKKLIASEINNDINKQEIVRKNEEQKRCAAYQKAKTYLKIINETINSLESDRKNIQELLKETPLHFGRLHDVSGDNRGDKNGN